MRSGRIASVGMGWQCHLAPNPVHGIGARGLLLKLQGKSQNRLFTWAILLYRLADILSITEKGNNRLNGASSKAMAP
jgi:hypothetical protein